MLTKQLLTMNSLLNTHYTLRTKVCTSAYFIWLYYHYMKNSAPSLCDFFLTSYPPIKSIFSFFINLFHYAKHHKISQYHARYKWPKTVNFCVMTFEHLMERTSKTMNPYILRKNVLSRTLKGSSVQPSAGTFKGSRWPPLEMILGGTLPEEP